MNPTRAADDAGKEPFQFFHYGWVIVIGGFLCQACFGVSRHLYPYLLPTMEVELNLLHEQSGSIASAYFIGYAIMTFVWGVLTDRIGSRRCMLMGQCVLLAGLTGMGFVSTFILASLCYFLCGAGAAGLFVPLAPLISRWFGKKRRGTALGIAMAGTGLVTLVLSFVIPGLLASYSWRWSWWIGAAFVLAIVIICWFVLVESPGGKHLTPMGIDKGTPAGQDVMGNYQQTKPKVSMKHILKRGVLWNLAGIYFTRAIGYTIFMTFAVCYLEEIGWQEELAAAVFGVWGALQIPSPVVWGVIADHIPKKYAFAIALALDAVGVFIFLSGSALGCYLGAAIIGFADVGVPTIMAASMADYFEPVIIGTALGFVTLIFGIGCIVAPTIGGYLGDMTGTLHITIMLSLGAISAALILALVLKKPSTKPLSH